MNNKANSKRAMKSSNIRTIHSKNGKERFWNALEPFDLTIEEILEIANDMESTMNEIADELKELTASNGNWEDNIIQCNTQVVQQAYKGYKTMKHQYDVFLQTRVVELFDCISPARAQR